MSCLENEQQERGCESPPGSHCHRCLPHLRCPVGLSLGCLRLHPGKQWNPPTYFLVRSNFAPCVYYPQNVGIRDLVLKTWPSLPLSKLKLLFSFNLYVSHLAGTFIHIIPTPSYHIFLTYSECRKIWVKETRWAKRRSYIEEMLQQYH